jgi:autophagy-related protein 16
MTTWKNQFYYDIINRNKIEAVSFNALVEAYDQVLRDCIEFKSQNISLKKQLKTSKEQNDELKEQIESLKSNGATVQVTSQRVRELEEKVYNLQEELTTSFRAKAETAQALLELNNEIKQLRAQLKEKKSELEDVQTEKENLSKNNAELNQTIQQKTETIDTLVKENEAIRQKLSNAEDRVKQLEGENKTMIERVIDQKQKQVDAMNQVNELHRDLMIQKQKLATLQAKYQTGSRDSITTGLESISDSGEQFEITTIRPPDGVQFDIALETQINCIDFSEDNHLIALGGNDKTVKLYHAKTGQIHSTLYGCVDSVTAVAFSPNNQMVLGGSTDSGCRVWNVGTGRARHTLTGHTKQIYAADFATDTKVVTGSYDRTIKVWELNQGTCLKTLLNAKSIVNDLETSKISNSIVSAHFDCAIRMFDLRTYDMVKEISKAHDNQVTSVNISRDDTYIVTCGKDSVIKIWDSRKSYDPVHILKHNDFKVTINTNKAVFSPCGSYVASGSANGQVYVWHIISAHNTPMENVLKGHKGVITDVAWSFDGSQVASSSVDKHVMLYQ